ncbi:MAG: hypothetical protein ABFE13_12080 [Phycisphaerales bacterium]
MSDVTVVVLGTLRFSATSVEVGSLPRTIGVACNALSPKPLQTTDFTSGYRPITIEGYLRGLDTQLETAAAHLVRLKANLKSEVAKDTNTLEILWAGTTVPESFDVYKNNDEPVFKHDASSEAIHRLFVTVTLNCLP